MLSLILPTYNEAENIRTIVQELQRILAGIPHEIIVVDDDSPDGTWKIAEEMAKGLSGLHVMRRVGRRGLSSAVVEGFAAAKGAVLAVADADGQHDYALLPRLYDQVREHGGIAIGSRYVEGGGVGDWHAHRHSLSRLANRFAIRLCRLHVTDPMSGFFAVSRQTFGDVRLRLRPRGFKILFEILLHISPSTPVAELPYVFRLRTQGGSKMSLGVSVSFIGHLAGAVVRRSFLSASSTGAVLILCAFLAAAASVPSILRIPQMLPFLDSSVRRAAPQAVSELRRQGLWVLDAELQSVTKQSSDVCFRWSYRYSARGRREAPEFLQTCIHAS